MVLLVSFCFVFVLSSVFSLCVLLLPSLEKKPKKQPSSHLFLTKRRIHLYFLPLIHQNALLALSLHTSSAFFSKISFYKSQNGSHHRGVFVVLVVVVQIKRSKII